MPSIALRITFVLAILFAGALAGGNLDRAIVAMPAWQHVGAVGWAEFSRYADLGNGLFYYPFEAIAAALLTIAAAIGFHFHGTSRMGLILLYASAILAIMGLGLTAKAAPIMLGVRDTQDPRLLQTAFEGFWYWGNIRAICQVLSFVALVSASPWLLRTDSDR